MKKIKNGRIWGISRLLIILVIIFGAASCGSTPPVEEELPPVVQETPPPAPAAPPAPPPEPEPAAPVPSQAELDSLNAAIARAEAARELAGEFSGDYLFPYEWHDADNLYNLAVEQTDTATPESVRDSTARYIAAAEALEALARSTLDRSFEITLQELMDARNEAINAGAFRIAPDYLSEADRLTESANTNFQNGDYHSAREEAFNALNMYNLLTTGLTAFQVREEIERLGFSRYDSSGFASADNLLNGAINDYLAGSLGMARVRIDEAARRYNEILNIGWRFYALEHNNAALAQRQRALDVRADIASREEFDSAQAVYSNGAAAYQESRFQEAIVFFIQCAPMFDASRIITLERRSIAEDALIRANQRMAESDETARNVEAILRGVAP